MKTTTQSKTTFTFYRDNRLDQKYTLTIDELKQKYLEYLQKKDPEWVLYYGHRSVWSFISADDGLKSAVDDPSDYVDLEEELMETRHQMPCYRK